MHCFRGAHVWISMCSFRWRFWEFFSHRYHSCTDLIFFMAFANMCVQIVLSVKSLCTYLTCEHTFTACMNLKMPCKVSFFEHISTFITFFLLMPLNVVMVHFGSGYKRFFTLCTDMLKHCPDLTKSRAELALDSPKSKSPPTIWIGWQNVQYSLSCHFFASI